MSDELNTIGKRLHSARKERGWSRRVLAEAVKERFPDCDPASSTINSIERDLPKKHSYFLNEIAFVLGVNYRWLRYGQGARKPTKQELNAVYAEALEETFTAILIALGLPQRDAEELLSIAQKVAADSLAVPDRSTVQAHLSRVLIGRSGLAAQAAQPAV